MSYQIDGNKKDEKRSWRTSLTIHAILLVLLFIPFLTIQIPPPGQEGILVSFGNPDMGQGDSRPDTQQEEVVPPKPPSEPEVAESQPEEVAAEPEVTETAPEPEPAKEETKEVVTAEDPEVAALKKKKQEEERKKQLAEAEAKRKEEAKIAAERKRKQAEAEAKRKAEEETRQKAAAEATKKAEYEKAKKQFGDLFGGSGKGKTGKPGNQGDPLGDPDAKNLEGISSGTGNVGGGLRGRGVKYVPKVIEKSQKTGRVVIKVCVGREGKVTTATFTQRGSTTADPKLVSAATNAAKKYKFTEGSVDNQCGTITFDFKVK